MNSFNFIIKRYEATFLMAVCQTAQNHDYGESNLYDHIHDEVSDVHASRAGPVEFTEEELRALTKALSMVAGGVWSDSLIEDKMARNINERISSDLFGGDIDEMGMWMHRMGEIPEAQC